MRKEHY